MTPETLQVLNRWQLIFPSLLTHLVCAICTYILLNKLITLQYAKTVECLILFLLEKDTSFGLMMMNCAMNERKL